MPFCKRCEKKVSIFDVDPFGLCPECSRATDPDYVGAEQAARVLREDAAKKRAALEQAYAIGDLPELPCLEHKTLKLRGNSLTFITKKKNVSIPLQNIASFSLQRAGHAATGTITVQLQKGNDAFISFGVLGAVGFGSEMSALYEAKHEELAELYEKYILEKLGTPQVVRTASQGAEAVPTINDLRALKMLVDEGVLTEEEFTAKKKQLLGI